MSTTQRHPEDEFDVAGRQRGAQGSHREQPSRRSLLPFLAFLAGLVVIVWVVALLAGGDDSGQPAVDPAPASPTDAAPSEGAAPPPDSPTEGAQAGEVDPEADVVVLNGASVAGIAGRTAETLTEAGFTAVETGNQGPEGAQESTVFYADPALEATAQAIADELGIGSVALDPEASAGSAVTVLLRPDFEEQ